MSESRAAERPEIPCETPVLRLVVVRRVLASNVINMLGSAAAPVALAFAALGGGGGVFTLGMVLAANTLPSIIFLLYGGVLADRTSRSTLLKIGRLSAGTVQLLVAVLVLTSHASTVTLSVLAFFSGAVAAVTRPAGNAIFKQIVATSQLQQVNALNRLSSNIVRVSAPALAGIAVALTSPGWVLVFDAVTFFLSTALLLGLRVPATHREGTSNPWKDVAEGLRAVRSRSWLVANMVFGSVIVVLWRVGFELDGPAVAKTGYHGAAAWGLVRSAFAIGLVGGGIVCLQWKPHRLAVVSVAASGLLALPLLALGFHLPLSVVAAAALVTGAGLDVAIVCWLTALGQHIPDVLQGRVQSVSSLGELSAVPFGFLAAALLGSPAWLDAIALVAGIGIAAATVGNLLVRSVWTINRLA